MKRIIFLMICLAALCGLDGCATGGYAQSSQSEMGYEKFFDSYNEWRLVERNNDLWLEKRDRSEAMQVTHTSGILEGEACTDGKYIGYREDLPNGEFKYYSVKFGSDDSARQNISGLEFVSIRDNH